MIFVCSAGLLLIVLLYLCTMKYKRIIRKRLNRKIHRLWFLYGLAMFAVDRVPRKLISGNEMINTAIKELAVKDKVQNEKYLYAVQKTAISILVIFISLLVGLIMSISESLSPEQFIESFARDSTKINTYNFVAEDDGGETETVVLDINRRRLSKIEAEELLQNSQTELVRKLLGENESLEKVNIPLNLVSSLGEDIRISWDISDADILNYDGEISDKVSEKGEVVILTANMTLGETSQTYSFAANIYPNKNLGTVQQQLQKFVNENGTEEDIIKLPTVLNGKKMKYYYAVSKSSPPLVLVGLVVAVLIFFLKDRDLQNELKKRNSQLLTDYPEIVSKMLLYYGAGLSVKSGIERIIKDYKKEKQNNKKVFRYAYEELDMALIKMKSGISEREAISEYGSRCGLHCYIKLTGIIEQNIKRGTKDIVYALKNELNAAMSERKNEALKKGGEISTKLLGPMVIMLIVSLVIIMLPALWSVNI